MFAPITSFAHVLKNDGKKEEVAVVLDPALPILEHLPDVHVPAQACSSVQMNVR